MLSPIRSIVRSVLRKKGERLNIMSISEPSCRFESLLARCNVNVYSMGRPLETVKNLFITDKFYFEKHNIDVIICNNHAVQFKEHLPLSFMMHVPLILMQHSVEQPMERPHKFLATVNASANIARLNKNTSETIYYAIDKATQIKNWNERTIEVLIDGDFGPQDQHILQGFFKKNLGNRLVIRGNTNPYVSWEEKERTYANTKIVVILSGLNMSFPLLDAMAHSCQILTHQNPVMNEFLINEDICLNYPQFLEKIPTLLRAGTRDWSSILDTKFSVNKFTDSWQAIFDKVYDYMFIREEQ